MYPRTRGEGGRVMIFILASPISDPTHTLIPPQLCGGPRGRSQTKTGRFFPTCDISVGHACGEVLWGIWDRKICFCYSRGTNGSHPNPRRGSGVQEDGIAVLLAHVPPAHRSIHKCAQDIPATCTHTCTHMCTHHPTALRKPAIPPTLTGDIEPDGSLHSHP